MCGIVWVHRKDGKPAAKSVLRRYRKQQHRGREGFGFVGIQDNKVVSYHRAEKEEDILDLLMKDKSPEILFHHRWPTSTPNVEESAHPLLVEKQLNMKNEYFVAHNGVITNASELFREHQKQGFQYRTRLEKVYRTPEGKMYPIAGEAFNDSEALAVDAALVMEGLQEGFKTHGAAAVVGLQVRDGRVVARFAYRNTGNPLVYQTDRALTTLCSVGKGQDVPSTGLFFITSGGLVRSTPTRESPPTYVSSYGGQFPHRVGAEAIKTGLETDLSKLFPEKKEVAVDFLPFAKNIGESLRQHLWCQKWVKSLTLDNLWEQYDVYLGRKNAVEQDLERIRINGLTTIELPSRVPLLQNRKEYINGILETIEKEIDGRSPSKLFTKAA